VAFSARSKSFWVDVNGNPLEVKFDEVDKNQQDVMDWDFQAGQPSRTSPASFEEHVDI